MKDDKFTEFTEQCLSLCRDGGWEKQIKAKENLAWIIHEEFPPTGSLLLGHVILGQGRSYLKSDIATKDFAKELVVSSFTAVQALKEKDSWDYYCLGVAYDSGRGTSRDYLLAAEAFAKSSEAGNPYAEFEAIWARHLAGGSRLNAILELSVLRGKLADFSAYSARALTLLELGPPKVPASWHHFTRLLLMRQALHSFICHDHGAKQINIAIEKELREGVDDLKALNSPRGNLALYLTSQVSRTNPTGRNPLDWLQEAIEPDMPELLFLCRRGEFDAEELRVIVDRATSEGWSNSELARLAASKLELLE